MRAAVLMVLTCLACDTGVEPGEAALSPSCIEAQDHSDLEWLQDEVFTPSCASFSACHMGAARSAQGLNLEPGQTHDQVVGVPSLLEPALQRVNPGNPDESLLIILIDGIESPKGPIASDLGSMPPQSDLLCEQKRAALRRWVEGLAAASARSTAVDSPFQRGN